MAFANRIRRLEYLVQKALGNDGLGLSSNFAMITADTANTTGHTASAAIVALVQLKARKTGVFTWTASCANAAAVAADAVTFTVTSQTTTSRIAYTTATNAKGYSAVDGNAAPGAGASGVVVGSGTSGVTVTGGPFGELTQSSSGIVTVGTAGTGASFAASGILDNSVTGAAGVLVPFTIGNFVILTLKYTNSVADRVVNEICLSLTELNSLPTAAAN